MKNTGLPNNWFQQLPIKIIKISTRQLKNVSVFGKISYLLAVTNVEHSSELRFTKKSFHEVLRGENKTVKAFLTFHIEVERFNFDPNSTEASKFVVLHQ